MKNKVILCIISLIIICFMFTSGCGKKEYILADHLDEVIISIDSEQIITLGDLSYYIYAVEQSVQAQAQIYNNEDLTAYWNIHTNGKFIKLLAKENCLDTIIRDYVLADEAKKENISLSNEEVNTVEEYAVDVYTKMPEEMIQRTGITESKLTEVLTRAQLASIYADYLVNNNNIAVEDIAIGGIYFNGLRDKRIIEINEDTWDKVEFGKITVNYKN